MEKIVSSKEDFTNRILKMEKLNDEPDWEISGNDVRYFEIYQEIKRLRKEIEDLKKIVGINGEAR